MNNEKVYSVFVGGEEVNDYFLTYEEAMNLAFDYFNNGYSKKDIEVFDCTNGYEDAKKVKLDF